MQDNGNERKPGAENPYAAPKAVVAGAVAGAMEWDALNHRQLTLGEVLRGGWQITLRCWQQIIVISLIGHLPVSLLVAAGGDIPQWVDALAHLTVGSLVAIALAILAQEIARGGQVPTPMQALSYALPRWPMAFLASFAYFVAIVVGFLLLVIPGIIALIRFSQAMHWIALRSPRIGDAFTRSVGMTDGRASHVFAVNATIGFAAFVMVVPGSILGAILFGAENQGVAGHLIGLFNNVAATLIVPMGVVFFLNLEATEQRSGE